MKFLITYLLLSFIFFIGYCLGAIMAQIKDNHR